MATAVRKEQLHAGDRRQGDARTPVGQPSTMRIGDGTPSEIEVEDLSCRGLLFRTDQPLNVGAAVQIGLAGAGAAPAVVVRRDGDKHGATFVRPLTPAQLAAAFSGGTVVRALFPSLPTSAPAPVIARWPRPLRAATWLAAAALPWTVIGAVLFR